jgi:hypothetical protein
VTKQVEEGDRKETAVMPKEGTLVGFLKMGTRPCNHLGC